MLHLAHGITVPLVPPRVLAQPAESIGKHAAEHGAVHIEARNLPELREQVGELVAHLSVGQLLTIGLGDSLACLKQLGEPGFRGKALLNEQVPVRCTQPLVLGDDQRLATCAVTADSHPDEYQCRERTNDRIWRRSIAVKPVIRRSSADLYEPMPRRSSGTAIGAWLKAKHIERVEHRAGVGVAHESPHEQREEELCHGLERCIRREVEVHCDLRCRLCSSVEQLAHSTNEHCHAPIFVDTHPQHVVIVNSALSNQFIDALVDEEGLAAARLADHILQSSNGPRLETLIAASVRLQLLGRRQLFDALFLRSQEREHLDCHSIGEDQEQVALARRWISDAIQVVIIVVVGLGVQEDLGRDGLQLLASREAESIDSDNREWLTREELRSRYERLHDIN